MRKATVWTTGALAALLCGPAAEAAPAPNLAPDLAPAFAGTIVSTYPDGRQAKLWLEPDGAYRGQGRRGGASSGRWKLKDQRICLRQSKPVPAPFSWCTALPPDGATRWSGKAVTGEAVRIELVAGR